MSKILFTPKDEEVYKQFEKSRLQLIPRDFLVGRCLHYLIKPNHPTDECD